VSRRLRYLRLAAASVLAAIMVLALLPAWGRPAAAAVSWHPKDWDTVLPPGVDAVRSDKFRIVPDQKLTPGACNRDTTLKDLATPGFIKKARNVPESEKKKVYAEYSISAALKALLRKEYQSAPFEVDHDISLENGGSNDISNLWPEPYFGAWNAHDKDRLENYLHKISKAGTITLAVAQDDSKGYHWVWSYIHFFGSPPKDAEQRARSTKRTTG
jgi:hypothetical protein